ncbi:hypothetical protein OEZ86_011031 [Tetradesmus obliquus]|nr:hypothetical protein OEZ86_011031 [Tetradesmus obliquus]
MTLPGVRPTFVEPLRLLGKKLSSEQNELGHTEGSKYGQHETPPKCEDATKAAGTGRAIQPAELIAAAAAAAAADAEAHEQQLQVDEADEKFYFDIGDVPANDQDQSFVLVHGRVYCEKLGGWKRLVTYGNLQKLHLNIHVWERMEAGSENGTPWLTGELAALHG